MEGLLYRILNGYIYKKIGKKTLKIYYPSKELIYKGNFIYEEILKSDGYSSSVLLKKTKIWSFEDDIELQQVQDSIERLKQQLYESFFNSQAESIRRKLSEEKEKLNKLSQKKNTLDSYTIESVAEYSRLAFFIEHCTYWREKKYNWKEWSIRAGIYYWLENIIPENKIREIARSDTWNSMIFSAKNFSTPIFKNCVDLNQDQIRLLSWTSLYTNIRNFEDCPHEEIIEDDDAFDGYLISKKEKKKVKHAQLGLEKYISPRVAKCEEIFVLPNAERNLDTIKQMVRESTSSHANIIKQSRMDALKKAGSLKHGAMPDVKQRMLIEANRKK